MPSTSPLMANLFPSLPKEKNGYRPLNPDHPPTTFVGRGRSVPADPQSILSQYRVLKGLKSIDSWQLAPLVDVEENRNITLGFSGKDATAVINVIDKVLNRIEGSEKTKLHAFKVLRKLAGKTCQVPKRYLVGWWDFFKVKDEIIASGGFSDIREGKLGLGGKVVAVKTIRVSRETDIDLIYKTFCKESVLWMNVSHPHVLRLIAVEIKAQKKKFSMITELMTNGSIMNYISTHRANRLGLLMDVADGLQYLHGLGVIHGDLKGPNILINNEIPPRACLADFGLGILAPSMTFDPTTLKDIRGTWGYMAPELFSEDGKQSREADMYALGVVIYEVVLGTRLHGQIKAVELPMLTITGNKPERPADPLASGFGIGTWEFIEKCWDYNRDQRPIAGEIFSHLKGVAATSPDVDPSPSPSAKGTSRETSTRIDNTSRNFSGLFPQ